MFAFTRTAFLTTLTVGLAHVAAAQTTGQRACQVDENSGQLGKALLSLSLAQNNQQAQKFSDAANHLRNAVKAAEKPDKKNELGHKLVLGKALSLWLNQPDVGDTPTRGTVGFTTATDARFDLVAAVDSNFSAVERSNPACEAETAPWRAQKPWLTMVNQAIEQVNSGNPDTAVALANRSLTLYRRAPYAYMVLANAAQNRGEVARAMQLHQQTIDASTDTSFADVRRQTMLTMGNLATEVADTATGATKAQFAREARAAYERLIGEAPNSSQAVQARGGLSRVLLIAGDTTAFRSSYRDQIENPTKYDYRDILSSAVAAARSKQWADAAALFENVVKLNPYNRDALYNLSVSYHELNQFDKMLPHLRRLLSVDPGHADNYLLVARAYNGIGRNAQKAKNVAAHRAANDSTVKYYQESEALPINVVFSEFSIGESKATVAGTIENRSKAEQTYNLRIEFLDRSGTPVGSQEVAVGPVAPKATGAFKTSIEAQNIAAFRYTKP